MEFASVAPVRHCDELCSQRSGRNRHAMGRVGRLGIVQLGRAGCIDKPIGKPSCLVMEAPITEAKKRLGELIDLAEAGETVVVLRHGKPVARIVPMPGRGRPWRVATPDNVAAYRGIDIDEPVSEFSS